MERDELLAARGERAPSHGNGSNQHEISKGEESSPLLKTTATVAAEVGLSERVSQQRKQAARDIAHNEKQRATHKGGFRRISPDRRPLRLPLPAIRLIQRTDNAAHNSCSLASNDA